MASAAELLSYTGSPQLGTGSNASVPVSTTKELNAVEDAGRTATLLNAQRNMYLFRQRISDRDKLLEALQAGLVKAGNILERDRPMFNSAVDKQTQAFKKWGGNPNDIDGALAYKKATQEAQDIVTKAQARYLTDVGEKQLIAAETSTEKRKRIQDNLDNYYKKGFYADFTPHQELLDFNHEEMDAFNLKDALVSNTGVKPQQETIRKTTTKMVNGKLTTVDVTTNQPVKAGTTKAALSVQPNGALSIVSTVPGKYYDYDKILTNASDAFVHDEKVREWQNMWRSYIENANPIEAKKVLDYTNQRIGQYNQERGFTEGDKGYVKPIEMDVDAVLDPSTGKFHINMPTAEFAAKTSLAKINGSYVEQDQTVFNKEVAQYLAGERKTDEEIRHNKASEGLDWKKFDLDRTKFLESTSGTEEAKNAAISFATSLFGDLAAKGTKAANGSIILTPDQIRTMTVEQRKYLGTEVPEERDQLGNVTKSGGLHPLELNDAVYDAKGNLVSNGDIIELKPDGTIFVMKDAKFDPAKGGRYIGKWDNTKSTSIWNAARNLVNEENQKSGTKERNAYYPIDRRGAEGTISIEVSGGGTKKSGTTDKKTGLSTEARDWKQEGNNWRYKDGTLYDANGKVIKQ